jgi:hypothetical protein
MGRIFSTKSTASEFLNYDENENCYSAQSVNSGYSDADKVHAFEPDSTYYNYCEFAKSPDRSSSERYGYSESQIQARFAMSSISEITYRIIPNPNNGVFSVITPDASQLEVIVHDSKGAIVYQGNLVPANNSCLIDLKTAPAGLFNCSIISEGGRQSFRFIISK